MRLNREKVRSLMLDNCMCVVDLAKVGNISVPTASKLLNHDTPVNMRTVGKIAKALDVSPQEILKEE